MIQTLCRNIKLTHIEAIDTQTAEINDMKFPKSATFDAEVAKSFRCKNENTQIEIPTERLRRKKKTSIGLVYDFPFTIVIAMYPNTFSARILRAACSIAVCSAIVAKSAGSTLGSFNSPLRYVPENVFELVFVEKRFVLIADKFD